MISQFELPHGKDEILASAGRAIAACACNRSVSCCDDTLCGLLGIPELGLNICGPIINSNSNMVKSH